MLEFKIRELIQDVEFMQDRTRLAEKNGVLSIDKQSSDYDYIINRLQYILKEYKREENNL
jgi:hypothetical protein